MDDRDEWRESELGKSALEARLDDDDDDDDDGVYITRKLLVSLVSLIVYL